MPHRRTDSYLEDALTIFRYYKKLAERAMEQVPDAGLFHADNAQSNSIAILAKHIAGNARSRWTDFLTTDGEKPDRHRDTEFEDPPETREALLAAWEDGWSRLFAALEPLTDADLTRTVTIRGEPHSVMQAVNRAMAHYASHVGQILMLAKSLVGEDWKSLSVPRGQSEEFNRRILAGQRD